MGKIIGIDLGTVNSVVAEFDGRQAKYIKNERNSSLIPSVVSYPENEDILVGEAAKDNMALEPERTVYSIKRLMGLPYDDENVVEFRKRADYKIVIPREGTKDSIAIQIGDREYSPIQVSREIIEHIKGIVKNESGEDIEYAVVTVPAYFNDIQRSATMRAVHDAGVRVLNLISEPMAAAMASRLMEGEDDTPKTVMVYDFGGGTFDISLLIITGSFYNDIYHIGDMFLGGDDLDNALADYINKDIHSRYQVDSAEENKLKAELRRESEKAKKVLSDKEKTKVIITSGIVKDKGGNPVKYEIEVTREKFEELIKPFIDRTLQLVNKAVDDYISMDEDNEEADIDFVLMAGNTTKVPAVKKALTDRFAHCDTKVVEAHDPKFIVAEGAALEAHILVENDQVLCPHCGKINKLSDSQCQNCKKDLDDTMPGGGALNMNYGIQTAGDKFQNFFAKGTITPTEPSTHKFFIKDSKRRFYIVPIYAGEDTHQASKNKWQATALTILPANCPVSTEVSIVMRIDGKMMVGLNASLDTGEQIPIFKIQHDLENKALDVLIQLWELATLVKLPENFDSKYGEVLDAIKEKRWKDAVQNGEALIENLNTLKIQIDEGKKKKEGEGDGGPGESREPESEMMKCPVCGADVPIDADRCEKCNCNILALQLWTLLAFLLNKYNWALCGACQKRMADILNKREPVDFESIAFLNHEEEVMRLVTMHIVIAKNILPFDRDLGNSLEKRLSSLEDERKTGKKTYQDIQPELDQLSRDIDGFELPVQPGTDDVKNQIECPNCHEKMPKHKLRCPHCGAWSDKSLMFDMPERIGEL
jgi:molecular chaperone DnaK (HSP70)